MYESATESSAIGAALQPTVGYIIDNMHKKVFFALSVCFILLAAGSFFLFNSKSLKVSPSNNPCNQTATTAPCEKIGDIPYIPPSSQNSTTEDYSTSTLSNFIFSFPSKSYLSDFGVEGVVMKENINITISPENNVFIFTKPAPLGGSFNASAKSLEDYVKGYPVSKEFSFDVLVNGKKETITTREEVLVSTSTFAKINDIPMLRQRYSIGRWSIDASGKKYFSDTDESEVHDELRYVFFDNKNYVIVTGGKSSEYIDKVAQSIRLMK